MVSYLSTYYEIVTILISNKVYHIDASSAEPVGGIARFKTVCNEYKEDPRFSGQPGLLTFFSGDAFNPSLESSVTKGRLIWVNTKMPNGFWEYENEADRMCRKSYGASTKHYWNGCGMCWGELMSSRELNENSLTYKPKNHDLDFGIRQFRHLTGQCSFPWLLANVLGGYLWELTFTEQLF